MFKIKLQSKRILNKDAWNYPMKGVNKNCFIPWGSSSRTGCCCFCSGSGSTKASVGYCRFLIKGMHVFLCPLAFIANVFEVSFLPLQRNILLYWTVYKKIFLPLLIILMLFQTCKSFSLLQSTRYSEKKVSAVCLNSESQTQWSPKQLWTPLTFIG